MEEIEIKRQLFHIFLGITALLILIFIGRGTLMALSFFTLMIGLLLVNLTFLGKKIFLVEFFREHFERKNIPFPGWGSACYATGVLLITSFLTDQNAIAASIIMLGIGDGVSTLIGKNGRITLPYNRKKTFEGSVAFFLSSLLGYSFVGLLIIPAAFLAATVESLDLPIDDNLVVPIATTAFFMVV